MASLLQLKRRIRAAQNVSKTTRAMQMIAASKMKKAQEAALSTRPYTEKLINLVQRVAKNIDKSDPETFHPYLKNRLDTKKTLLIAFSPDKGLCGGLITNLMREFLEFTKENTDVSYIVVGKKLEGQIAYIGKEILASFSFGNSLPQFDAVYPISRLIDEYYLDNKVDSVKILSAQFTSIFTQTPKISNILPIEIPQKEEKEDLPAGRQESSYLFEPNTQDLLPDLLKHYLEMKIYQELLESFVSEQASRMIAMQNATSNAKDIIEDLQLEYNKTRQAKITSEILDISSGR